MAKFLEFFNQKGGSSVVEFTYQKMVELVMKFFNQKGGSSVVEFTCQKVVKSVVEPSNQTGSLSVVESTDQKLCYWLWNSLPKDSQVGCPILQPKPARRLWNSQTEQLFCWLWNSSTKKAALCKESAFSQETHAIFLLTLNSPDIEIHDSIVLVSISRLRIVVGYT
jgi:hypothetical protein